MTSAAPLPTVGRLHEKFEGVRSIAVLRGGGLGDLIFALPAIDALAAAYPEAEITLLGMPLHRALLEGRPGPIARVEELPVATGIRNGEPDQAALDAWFDRQPHYDLAVQVHGGGRNSNPFLLRLGATHTIGSRTDDAAHLERDFPYIYYQHEVMRGLEAVALAGAVPVTLEPRMTALPHEVDAALARFGAGAVVIHPSATDPRRRWPADRFGAVGRAAAEAGRPVVVVGDPSEKELAAEVVAAAGHPGVVSAAGELSLSELVGVLAAADLVVANDSGPRHLGDALGTPSVGVFWFGNVVNAAPFSRSRHRIEMSFTTHCPVCGRDATQVGWTAERCEHDPSFVADVTTDRVLAQVESLLGGL
ncbi:glycosyltransferase family 9 protein [Herbiconiux sp. SYSU D00978]|uniref:glycosyltransferase family 9 protein n=1 Tax=Herbiconiux sp. SYSU D00978 TaxID=2812562 RepID=UPI0027DD5FA4|nr:glycosyltransferase family 9 protein [Herbiconiux sp. SYSU D00978]